MGAACCIFGCDILLSAFNIIRKQTRMEKFANPFEDLKVLSTNLKDAKYEGIIEIFAKKIKLFPITSAFIHKGATINRARVNRRPDKFFTSAKELTHITDP